MKEKFIQKLALIAIGIVLFSCDKIEEFDIQSGKNTIEEVLGDDLLKQIEIANKAQHQLVLKSVEELKAEGEIVTIDQINDQIAENGVVFKSTSVYQEFESTTSIEILQKYAKLLSERLVKIGDTISDEAIPEEVFSFYDKEKDLLIKEILTDTSLSESQKRDIIVYLSISNARLITQLSVYEDVQSLLTGQVDTKFIGRAWRWVKKQWNNIVNSCAFAIVSSAIGGASYYTGVGVAIGTGLLRAGLPRLGYCFNKR
ncbi:hypothetical protein ACI76O_06495 [Capnocytophaga cynodegmi]|uniref:hypothetical protein n=1 Tax=Capnocytophaga cynodegmi TaxID=28189 RepID=UPI001AC41822|nr:hypothetical protein [Capnocytophaga cynodegmi]GIM52877.1 hypothetical protein CAPN004_19070 [Capnocytophaga cynodegmi]